MRGLIVVLCAVLMLLGCAGQDTRPAADDERPGGPPSPAEHRTLIVRKIEEDFEVSGAGEAEAWEKTDWVQLQVGRGELEYLTRFKTLYSRRGIYFLFDCEDEKLTATITEDFGQLYREDVVEVFLWPYEDNRVYFEYELSPLGYELPLLIPNHEGRFMGWMPWRYEGDAARQTGRATAVRGGEKEPHADIDGWTAEFFIPFALLRGLGNVPPESGTEWRANMYRIDYDEGATTLWVWNRLDPVNFHLIDQFGTIIFE